MLKRVRRGLEHFKERESNPEVASMMNMQSEIDAGKISGSYTLVKVFLWAIPIMGFIGTVLGISTAIAGLAGGMSGTVEMTALMDQLTTVTVGLGVAFDTTLVALCMSIVLSFPVNALQKAEEDLLAEVDRYCLENLLKRLSDAGGVSDVAMNTRALVNALAPALAESQQDLLQQLRDVGRSMVEGQTRQLELVERTTAAIEAQRAAIENSVGRMAERLEEESRHALDKTSERVNSSFKVLADGMRELNKVLRELDGKQVKIERRRKWLW
jgi:biopolymer transport protein ExbB/TolQ